MTAPPIAGPAPELSAMGPSHEIIARARRRLGQSPRVYFAPDIPPLVELAARAVHGSYLPETEPILVLYDATLVGNGENGLLLTPERVCWKNLFEHGRQIEWADLDPQTIVAEIGCVEIASGAVFVRGELAGLVGELLIETAELRRAHGHDPYRARTVTRAKVKRLAALARAHLGEVDDLYYHPSIPARKLRGARRTHAHHLDPREPVAVLYDDTVFGGGQDGFVMTTRHLCWKNLAGTAGAVLWADLDARTVSSVGSVLNVMGGTVRLSRQGALAAAMASFLAVAGRDPTG